MKSTWRVRLRRPESRVPTEGTSRFTVPAKPPSRIRRIKGWAIPVLLLAGVPSLFWMRTHGVVEARGRIDGTVTEVGSPDRGTIASIDVRVGDYVRAGQVLARLDSAELDAVVKQREADIARAKADRARLESDWRQTRSLAARGYESARNAITARHAFEAACGAVAAAEAAHAAALARCERLVLRAPGPGQVLWEPLANGSVVDRDVPVVTLLDEKTLHLVAYVREAHRDKIRIGQRVHFVLDGFPEREFEGRISFLFRGVKFRPKEVSAFDDPDETYQPVRVMPNDPDALRQLVGYGMRARVRIDVR